MSKDYSETIIRLDHDGKFAEVWTQNRAVLSLLKRTGAIALERQIKGEWWRVGCRTGRRGFILGKTRSGGLSGRKEAMPASVISRLRESKEAK